MFTHSGDGDWSQQAYVKASNTAAGDRFGAALALAGGGDTMAVGAPNEDGSAGAAYLFTRNDAAQWSQQDYLKASNAGQDDLFSVSVALSADGGMLAVSALNEGSAATGLNGDESGNDAVKAGAVYVFTPDVAGDWRQRAYVKASNTDARDRFGIGLALSGDGGTLAAGADGEKSAATGIDGDQDDNSLAGPEGSITHAGAVYLY